MTKFELRPISGTKEAKAQHDVVSKQATNLTERRSAPRLENGFNAACEQQSVSYNVEIVDLSRYGARIRIRQGLMPMANAAVALCFMDGESSKASVVWTKGTECGLQFLEPLSDLDGKRHFDEMGADFFHAILNLQVEK